MKKILVILFVFVCCHVITSCKEGKSIYIKSTTPAYDMAAENEIRQMYLKLCGHYWCEEINMSIWLYEDGTFVENNKWGWFGGTYEYDRPLEDMDYTFIREMKLYPPSRDQSLCNLKYIYIPNKTGSADCYRVYDRDGSPVKITSFRFFDSVDNHTFQCVKTSGDTIPRTAKYIHVSDGSAVVSGKVPYLRGFDIVFFIRPNYNRCNLRWSESKGLYYVSNNGEIHYFRKMNLKPIPRMSPPVSDDETFRDGEIVYPKQF